MKEFTGSYFHDQSLFQAFFFGLASISGATRLYCPNSTLV